MRLFLHTPHSVLVLCFIAAGGFVLGACGSSSPTAPSTPPATITALPSIGEMTADKSMGSANAPNTVIVYSSFTCSHCADFHIQTFPQLKSKYIDAGTVRYVFRDWERNTSDIHAAMLARCAGDAQYFNAVDTLFRNQASWAGSDQALQNVMRQFGMSQQVIDQCLATTALANAIVQSHNDGTAQFGVNGTPTFVVNEHIVVGDPGSLGPIEAWLH